MQRIIFTEDGSDIKWYPGNGNHRIYIHLTRDINDPESKIILDLPEKWFDVFEDIVDNYVSEKGKLETLSDLGRLAASYRGYIGQDSERKTIVEEYERKMKYLYASGWDDIVDMEDELPEEHMPKIYKDKHPLRKNVYWGDPKKLKE